MAVYVCGLIVGAHARRQRRIIRNFLSSLANGADIALFLLLGLLVFPSELPAVALPALSVVVVLLFVARPIAVAISMAPFGLSWREKTLLSWAGLRGALPIVLATFPATAGVPAGDRIFNIVFFVVTDSTLLQGTTVGPLAKRLNWRWIGRRGSRSPRLCHWMEWMSTSSRLTSLRTYISSDTGWPTPPSPQACW
ncbi:MAG: cation:proton antiporter [Acidimicrobiia bacterium]